MFFFYRFSFFLSFDFLECYSKTGTTKSKILVDYKESSTLNEDLNLVAKFFRSKSGKYFPNHGNLLLNLLKQE
ncbi:hypothetical protein AYI68_g1999 [Smittium mucronatum]|uniref:Uncharacterized protein n=1 Tax=Smittium mucronatum TaxID=133383 RepID=A0A1R0H3Y8_9FUNG|nr:hypothetical protein AYI68_g1999 [Smittium mucronatum]